jgi:hypothetical protein
MICFPKELVETKFPGYYWNYREETLYSIKVGGILRKLKYFPPNYWNHWRNGYSVSVNGCNQFLEMDYLKSLVPHPSTVPMENV